MLETFDITFITCRAQPDPQPDDLVTLQILRERGWRCQTAIWNDANVDWTKAGMSVIRSTWDYHLSPTRFIEFVRKLPHQLVNEMNLVLWNCNKRYLIELEQRNINIIPTLVISKKDVGNIENVLDSRKWQSIIIKPTIGLSTFGVKRFAIPTELDEAREHVEALLNHGDVLVQQFMPAVADYGERALSFFENKFSHAVRKSAFQKLASAGDAGETAVTATAIEIAFAEKVLSTLPTVPLYARVDLVPDLSGNPALMELELIEPSLFLEFDPVAPQRFADALERRLHQQQAVSIPQVIPQAFITG